MKSNSLRLRLAAGAAATIVAALLVVGFSLVVLFDREADRALMSDLDVHLRDRGHKTALVFEGEPGDSRRMSYQELHAEVGNRIKVGEVMLTYDGRGAAAPANEARPAVGPPSGRPPCERYWDRARRLPGPGPRCACG